MTEMAEMEQREQGGQGGNPTPVAEALDAIIFKFNRLMAQTSDKIARVEEALMAASIPLESVCKEHGEIMPVLLKQTARDWDGKSTPVPVYAPCCACEARRVFDKQTEWLVTKGVPPVVAHASFDNFMPETPDETASLEAARLYAENPSGFIGFFGRNFGCGKTHLAVAIMRSARRGFFVTQAALLANERARYENNALDNLVQRATHTALLVVDEIGMSVGGRDELPMLHKIFDHRYGYKLPVVMTGNQGTRAEIAAVIGERMMDRLSEGGRSVKWFTGRSRRADRKAIY